MQTTSLHGSASPSMFLSSLLGLQWLVQPHALHRTDDLVLAGAIDLAHTTLWVRVDHQPDEVRAHVVPAEIIQRFAELCLVEVDIDEHQPFKVFRRLLNQALSVGSVDSSVAVVDVMIFRFLAGRRLQLHTLGGDGLEGCERVRACLDGVRRGHNVSIGVADVGVWVRVGEGGGVRVKRPDERAQSASSSVEASDVIRMQDLPCSDVDLFAERNGVGLQKRVHVLPAVQLPDSADFSVHHHGGGVARAVPKDEAFHMRRADLTTVVDDIALRIDEDLRRVQTVEVQFGVSKGHENGILLCCSTNAVHFRRIRGETVLAVFLQQRQALLVSDLPHPAICLANVR